MIGALAGTTSLSLGAEANLYGVAPLEGNASLALNLVFGLALNVPLFNQVPGSSAIDDPTYPQPFGIFPIAIGVEAPYAFDWTDWLARSWEPGKNVALAQIVRPTVPNGFEFVAAQAGQSGNVEPAWPQLIGNQVIDGSVIWVCAQLDDASLISSIESATWNAPAGISILNGQIVGTLTPALIGTDAAQAGTDYTVTVTVEFENGTRLVGTLLLQVPQPLS